MSLLTLDHASLNGAIEQNDMLIVDLWASWCGPCRNFAPVYEQVSNETEGVTFGKFQTDASPENEQAFMQMGFEAVPTILFFKQANLLAAIPGALPKQALRDVIDQLKAFDISTLPAEDQAKQAAK